MVTTIVIVKQDVYTVEIINVVFVRGGFFWCGNICSFRQDTYQYPKWTGCLWLWCVLYRSQEDTDFCIN